MTRPIVLSLPAPRTLELIFRPAALATLRNRYDLREADTLDTIPSEALAKARYIIGQPPVTEPLLAKMTGLRCVLNVEGNLYDNMPYAQLFERGIHVVTTAPVFAQPVAEIGLGFALDLLRGVSAANAAFTAGQEVWGLEGNRRARLLSGAEVGVIGYGELGRALHRLLVPFQTRLRIHDPWLPESLIADAGAEPATLDAVLRTSDVVFVVAGVTSENRGFLDAGAFSVMRDGAVFILLSRADVVDFPALIEAVASGRITAATDVWPEEPMPTDHPARRLSGLLKSAHRAGALAEAFLRMGDLVLDDMALMDRGLPPLRCKRAERETVARMRSKPVALN
jgi:phosphoglycerate dehydrogenase-like enzyme